MRKKRISIGVLIALMAVTAALTLSLTYQYALSRFNAQIRNLSEREQLYEKLSQIDNKTREKFYFNIDEKTLDDAIADGYVEGLGDAHSDYLTAEEASGTLQEISGKHVGLGIEVYRRESDGAMLVTRVMKNSPAAFAGMKRGDQILSVDGHRTEEEEYSQMIEYLVGKVDSEVTVSVKRDESEQPITVSMVRKEFELETVTSRVVGNAIGYVKIYEFSQNTGEEFNEELTALVKAGITGLILDVRDNPGGVLDAVAEVLDTILPTGNIVSVEYNDGTKKVLHSSDSAQLDLPVAVLVNENSASGAELLAAAIQDYGKGKVVGAQTYGKGTMQEIYTFTDGSALRLTVAKFFPPLSENFNGVGVTPDIPIEQSEEAKQNPYFLTDEQDTQLSTAISAVIITGADVSTTVSSPESKPESNPGAESGAETSSGAAASTAYEPGAKKTNFV